MRRLQTSAPPRAALPVCAYLRPLLRVIDAFECWRTRPLLGVWACMGRLVLAGVRCIHASVEALFVPSLEVAWGLEVGKDMGIRAAQRREVGDHMTRDTSGVRPRSEAGIRSAFGGPSRFGARRSWASEMSMSQAAQANEAFFSRQPPGTIAVRQDGIRLVVPGTLGDPGALDGSENLEFFDGDGTALGHIEILGVADTPRTCSLFAISNLSKVRGAAYLAVWYLTRHTAAPSFEVHSVNPATLGRLLKRLGMKWMAATNNMIGVTEEVCVAARRKCRSHHWRFRDGSAPS